MCYSKTLFLIIEFCCSSSGKVKACFLCKVGYLNIATSFQEFFGLLEYWNSRCSVKSRNINDVMNPSLERALIPFYGVKSRFIGCSIIGQIC